MGFFQAYLDEFEGKFKLMRESLILTSFTILTYGKDKDKLSVFNDDIQHQGTWAWKWKYRSSAIAIISSECEGEYLLIQEEHHARRQVIHIALDRGW